MIRTLSAPVSRPFRLQTFSTLVAAVKSANQIPTTPLNSMEVGWGRSRVYADAQATLNTPALPNELKLADGVYKRMISGGGVIFFPRRGASRQFGEKKRSGWFGAPS